MDKGQDRKRRAQGFTQDLYVATGLLAASVGTLIARWIMAGRLWNVRYDLLASWFDGPLGPGFVSWEFAVWSYLTGISGCIACIYGIIRKLGGTRSGWMLALPIAAISMLGLHDSPSEHDVPIIVRNAQPLIEAIDRYRADNRSYPTDLNELVPSYIEAIPETGLIRGRAFIYIRRDQKPPLHKSGPHVRRSVAWLGDNPYTITVMLVPSGSLVYRPEGDYGDLPGRDVGSGWRWSSVD